MINSALAFALLNIFEASLYMHDADIVTVSVSKYLGPGSAWKEKNVVL